MRVPSVSPSTYRRITLLAAMAVAVIIVTGGAVRLTGSGLGCPDWPNCARGRLIAPGEYHAMVEDVNRLFTGLVSVAVIVAALGSLRRVPRRRDLSWLSAGLVIGVLAQIALGGLTVLHGLAPPFVMAHFLLSMLLLADAVVLHHRAGLADGATRSIPMVEPELARMGWLVVAATAMVVFLGTVVTSSGPHGGDARARRLSFSLHDVARVHGAAVMLLLGLVIVMAWRLWAGQAPAPVLRRAEALLAVLAAQTGVGYLQYFTGVPALLVGVHIAGAAAVWVTALRLQLGLSAPQLTGVAEPMVSSTPAPARQAAAF